MSIIDELLEIAELIRDETEVEANTAERVGGNLVGIVSVLRASFDYTVFATSTQVRTSAEDIVPMGNTVISLSENAVLSISDVSSILPGYEMLLRIRNTASVQITVTLPSGPEYTNDDGPTVTIPAQAVAEVSLRCFVQGEYRTRFSVPSRIAVIPDEERYDASGNRIN